MMTNEFLLLSGTANPELAAAIAHQFGLPLCARRIARFPDGEISIELQQSVRGKEVFLIQPAGPPVDADLVELLALADACRRAAASRLTAVIPYFGYARADKRLMRGEPITARMVADTLASRQDDWPQLHTVSAAPLIAAALKHIHADGAFNDLY